LSFLFCSACQWNEDICKSSVFTISSRIGWWVLCCWHWWDNVVDKLLHLFMQLPMLYHLILVLMLKVGSTVWHGALFLFSWFVEPFYGTICLYNRERREKLSEDFYFHILPTEMQDVSYASSKLFCGFLIYEINGWFWSDHDLPPSPRFLQLPGQNYIWTSCSLLLRCTICFSLFVNPVREACYWRWRGYCFCLFT